MQFTRQVVATAPNGAGYDTKGSEVLCDTQLLSHEVRECIVSEIKCKGSSRNNAGKQPKAAGTVRAGHPPAAAWAETTLLRVRETLPGIRCVSGRRAWCCALARTFTQAAHADGVIATLSLPGQLSPRLPFPSSLGSSRTALVCPRGDHVPPFHRPPHLPALSLPFAVPLLLTSFMGLPRRETGPRQPHPSTPTA